jgi:hypothetical protein
MAMGGQLEKGLNIDGGTDGTTIGNTSDSLKTNITNAAGASAVNIQDGGNSITVDDGGTTISVDDAGGSLTVDGTVAVSNFPATQPVSGTVTANAGTGTFAVSAASLPLPAGASTSALQTTGNSSLSSIDSKLPTVGQKTMAGSQPVVIASDQSAITVTSTVATRATYSAAASSLTVAASATDIFTITGSASRTVRILRISLSAWKTAVSSEQILLIKRSTANSGGTSATLTAVPHDSTNAAATATVRSYTANPTLGTAVGTIRSVKLPVPTQTPSNAQSQTGYSVKEWEFGKHSGQAVVLRGTSEVLAVNLNAVTVAGSNFSIDVEFTEE